MIGIRDVTLSEANNKEILDGDCSGQKLGRGTVRIVQKVLLWREPRACVGGLIVAQGWCKRNSLRGGRVGVSTRRTMT